MTSTDTTSDAYQYARTIADEVVGVAHGDLDGYQPDDYVDALMTWMTDLVLDVEVTRNVTTGDVTAVEVARTLGGPGAWVTFRDGEVTVLAVWGRERATVSLWDAATLALVDVVLDAYAEVIA
jgi:NADPH-dependent curcumin reductase CurA